jgi:uncharacterized damage-inducible protein DinB
MTTIHSTVLIENLEADVRALLVTAARLQQMDKALLERSPAPGRWSIAQVLEHLNFYAEFYTTAIENKLHLHRSTAKEMFSSGWLGNYFTRLMQPGVNNVIAKKMKAPKNALPAAAPDATEMLSRFIAYQHQLLGLLQLARGADMGSIRIPTSLSSLIRLKLGDTFRFVIAHEQRHFVQVTGVLQELDAGFTSLAGA